MITRERLQQAYDWREAGEAARSVVDDALATLPGTVRFLYRYVAWNACFGSGVSALAAKIGRSRALFLEPGWHPALADRSVLVASYVFDAARDEFDDRSTPYRDTHRCLAQATLAGLVEHARSSGLSATAVDALLAEPAWLATLRDRIADGYGVRTPDERATIFRGIGYHLGSELLADREFSVIHEELRAKQHGLLADLAERTVTIAGQPHPCAMWIEVHSGHGGGAEADHFEWALEGVGHAFAYSPASLHAELEAALLAGYLEFVADHRTFFGRVNES
ncbi:MAG: hypothetical protein IT379_09600 [Deltaproteobacteria bacterium]|nr:hypothetical protein [Deltaproteobacteria bacterium]